MLCVNHLLVSFDDWHLPQYYVSVINNQKALIFIFFHIVHNKVKFILFKHHIPLRSLLTYGHTLYFKILKNLNWLPYLYILTTFSCLYIDSVLMYTLVPSNSIKKTFFSDKYLGATGSNQIIFMSVNFRTASTVACICSLAMVYTCKIFSS
jgi:hypothetical protein